MSSMRTFNSESPEDVRRQIQEMATASGFDAVVLNTQPSVGRFTSVERSLEMFAENVIGRIG